MKDHYHLQILLKPNEAEFLRKHAESVSLQLSTFCRYLILKALGGLHEPRQE